MPWMIRGLADLSQKTIDASSATTQFMNDTYRQATFLLSKTDEATVEGSHQTDAATVAASTVTEGASAATTVHHGLGKHLALELWQGSKRIREGAVVCAAG